MIDAEIMADIGFKVEERITIRKALDQAKESMTLIKSIL